MMRCNTAMTLPAGTSMEPIPPCSKASFSSTSSLASSFLVSVSLDLSSVISFICSSMVAAARIKSSVSATPGKSAASRRSSLAMLASASCRPNAAPAGAGGEVVPPPASAIDVPGALMSRAPAPTAAAARGDPYCTVALRARFAVIFDARAGVISLKGFEADEWNGA